MGTCAVVPPKAEKRVTTGILLRQLRVTTIASLRFEAAWCKNREGPSRNLAVCRREGPGISQQYTRFGILLASRLQRHPRKSFRIVAHGVWPSTAIARDQAWLYCGSLANLNVVAEQLHQLDINVRHTSTIV